MGLEQTIHNIFNEFQKGIDLQPHQETFCAASQDLVFFGGGAGGGKTFAALLDNLQGVHDPDYISIFFRSTTTEINKGLWLEAKKLYMPLLTVDGTRNGKFLGQARINEKDHAITFPSGATTFFGYLERDDHAADRDWETCHS